MASSAPPDQGKPTEQRKEPTTSDLFSSAKVVAEAAQSTFSNQGDKVDKVKAAGAAEDLLGAASKYGKLEEKGYAGYVEKAENYLHQYSKSTTPAAAGSAEHEAKAPAETKEPATESTGGDDKSGGGFGQAFKVAQGLFK